MIGLYGSLLRGLEQLACRNWRYFQRKRGIVRNVANERRSRSGQCIMKKRPLQKVEAGCGAASAALRCPAASLPCGGAWGVTAVVYAVGRTAEGHRQIGGMNDVLILRGKISVRPNTLPPNMPEFAKAFGCNQGQPLVREGPPGMVEKCAALGLGPRVDFWKNRRCEDRARVRYHGKQVGAVPWQA